MIVDAGTFVQRAAALLARERERLHEAYGDAIGRDVRELPTPMLLLDLPAAKRNVARMATGIAERHSALRPHIKVHKSPDLSRLQIEAGAIGLSVATVWEAVVMAAADIDDLFVVNTVAGDSKLRTLAELARERRILVAVDQVANAETVAAAATAAGSEIGVLIEVDTGMDRAGVDTPEDATALARAVDGLAGLRLEGVTGYEGHCSMENDVAVRTSLQREAMGMLLAARDALLAAGLPCPIVSAGGTRTWWLTAATPGVTEIQAGTYIVMDAFHQGLEGGFEHALHVGTTVISRAPGRLIVDVGSKTVAAPDLARLVGIDVPVVRLDEEHGIFESSDPQPTVGTFVRLVPGYGPSTVASFDVFHVVEDDRVVDLWPVIPRGPGHAGLARLLEGGGAGTRTNGRDRFQDGGGGTMRFDLLIRGGDLVDPGAGRIGRFDVAVAKGRVAAVDAAIPTESAVDVIDATGLLVMPGLIDLHTHVFRGVGYFGIDADSVAARSGVTTWVDAGSAGAFNLPGFREYVVDRARVRVLAFANLSYLGLAGLNYDEYCNLDSCDVDVLERAVARYSDIIVGIKVRMGTGKVGNQGLEPLRIAREASERTGLRLMVHIANAPPAVEEVLNLLRPGDIVTHAFTGLSERLVDEGGTIKTAALDARASEIKLDIGHGSGSFSFDSAEVFAAAGFWPDTISTDLHQVSLPGPNLLDPLAQDVVARVTGDGTPAFTLLTVMSKLLHLGMPLREVIAAATSRPASVIGLEADAGTLRVGGPADIAILRLSTGQFELRDIHGARRTAHRLLEHEATILGGRVLEPGPMPEAPPWIRLVDREGAA